MSNPIVKKMGLVLALARKQDLIIFLIEPPGSKVLAAPCMIVNYY